MADVHSKYSSTWSWLHWSTNLPLEPRCEMTLSAPESTMGDIIWHVGIHSIIGKTKNIGVGVSTAVCYLPISYRLPSLCHFDQFLYVVNMIVFCQASMVVLVFPFGDHTKKRVCQADNPMVKYHFLSFVIHWSGLRFL
jgi:hypothetical protein